MADEYIRICAPVSVDPFRNLLVPAAVRDVCSSCGAAVWVDSEQQLPPELPAEGRLMCTPCAASHPVYGPSLLENLATAIEQHEMLGKTHMWMIDDGKEE